MASIDFNDKRWTEMLGGYRVPFDPRAALAQIRDGVQTDEAWRVLWEGLHHQGDVGEASYAAVPFLVEFCKERGERGWNLFAMVAVIELARQTPTNPPLPASLERDYTNAIDTLGQMAAAQILETTDPLEARAKLAVLAIRAGQPAHADALLSYSDQEIKELDQN
jgi:hypothetical protein